MRVRRKSEIAEAVQWDGTMEKIYKQFMMYLSLIAFGATAVSYPRSAFMMILFAFWVGLYARQRGLR